MVETYLPFPKGKDTNYWQKIKNPALEATIDRAQSYDLMNWQPLPFVYWLNYTREGNRVDYEDIYFKRRVKLGDLVMAEVAHYKGQYLDGILNGLIAICEESAWQLPAHNSEVRDEPSKAMPNVNRPILDLFACETGALLATVYYLLGEELERISPGLKERVRHELEHRIIRPYLDGWFWWMGGRGERTLNWTVWCTQNVLLTGFLFDFPQEVREEIVIKGSQSVEYFLADYGEDGSCDEGAGYYRHAGLCLYTCLDILDKVTGERGKFSKVWQEPKIKNIARYILQVHVEDKYYINYADCSPTPGPAGVREFLFGKKCQDSLLCSFAAKDAKNSTFQLSEGDISTYANLFYRVQEICTLEELYNYSISSETVPDIYYPSTGLFVVRDSRFCLGVKAGNNGDNHNHNDVGSVILYKNGKPLLIDLGVESYTAKTFSKDRYDIWVMQSSWHNLAQFDGFMEEAGSVYAATKVQVELGDEISSIQMELAGAWPKEAPIESYRRQVMLYKNNHVLIKDYCQGDYQEAYLNLMFARRPILNDKQIVLEDFAILELTGVIESKVQEVEIKDPRLQGAWGDKVYRVQLKFENEIAIKINYDIGTY
jgi:hypothetical protein